MNYRTVYQRAEAEIVEKKSRFIGEIYPVSTEEEAMQILEKVKKTYWDARHHCWAYVLGTTQVQERCSDDGEPSGTAGKPILEVLRGHELQNVLMIVTRYFGGTLLGTGGLVRAYTQASQAAVKESIQITKCQGYPLAIHTDYTSLGKIQHLLAQEELLTLQAEYTDEVCLTALVPEEREQEIRGKLIEATSGQARMERGEICWFTEIEGEVKLLS